MTGTLLRRSQVAVGTWELEFGLGGQQIAFRAGQYCRLALPALDRPDKKASRKFSIVNAPFDDQRLVVLTRAGRSGYKYTLAALNPGATARIEKIKGKFQLPTDVARPLVFIAGGVGIAPFMSMLAELEHRGPLEALTLLYFNRDPATTAYRSELEQLSARHRGFRLRLSMTRHPAWSGERERLSEALLLRALDDVQKYDFYIVGTPAMVTASVAIIKAFGVGGEHIHAEDFSGYER